MELLEAVQSTVGYDIRPSRGGLPHRYLPGIPSRRDLFFANFEIFVCDGAALDSMGDPRYLEVAPKLPSGAEPRAEGTMVHFWNKHLDKNFVKRFKGRFEGLCARPRPVYIPARNAHPLGCFVNETVCQPAKLAALFVAMYGQVNTDMCTFCIEASMDTTNPASDHLPPPFHTCISLPGITSGCCANCYYRQYHGCTSSASSSNVANPWDPIVELPAPPAPDSCPRVIDISSALDWRLNGEPEPEPELDLEWEGSDC